MKKIYFFFPKILINKCLIKVNTLLLGVFIVFLPFSIYAQQKKSVVVNSSVKTVREISLDGQWKFKPIKSGSFSTDRIDTKAKMVGTSAQKGWHWLRVPQFLNRIKWWLPRVSDEYEHQEKARVDSLPFNPKKVTAGWYKKTINLSGLSRKKQDEVYVNFEGIAMISRVYINGHHVGGHLGMFGSFECRLTPYLKWGQENSLVVYVERGAKAEKGGEVVSVAVTVRVTRDMLSSLNAGMFGGFGNVARAKFMGIWQPVTLKISQAGVHIKDVFFNPSLHGHQIEFTIQNPVDKPVTGSLAYSLTNRKTGKVLVDENLNQSLTIASETSKSVTIDKSGLQPKLWTPDHPNLYNLNVRWLDTQGKLVDRWSQEVGYRTVAVKGEHIYLNGKRYWVRGAGMPPYGYKPNSKTTAQGFLQKMHDGNTMVTRTGCNPWNHMWYKAADEIGIGVSSEGVRPWALMSKAPPPAKPILKQWKQEQWETVKQYRNHPSILFYEVSNEGLQGDAKNPKKLAIFEDIIDSMRTLDPSRPIIQTSGEPDYQNIADIEDVHSYWGWYEPSSYVNDYMKPKRGLTLQDGRPFFNEEAAVPYSSIDNGKVHPSYVYRYSAQSWVGDLGVFGDNSAYYQEHIRAEAKMKAEKLRYSRKKLPTAGFLLFTNTTWIQHALSRPPSEWNPFPVYYAVKKAFQPVLVAWNTPQRVFYTGENINPKIYVVNDDDKFRDLKGLQLHAEVVDRSGKIRNSKKILVGDVQYYAVREYPFEFRIPKIAGDTRGMVDATFRLRLTDAEGKLVSDNSYPIRIATKKWAASSKEDITIFEAGCDQPILDHLKRMDAKVKSWSGRSGKADVVLLGPDAKAIPPSQAKASLKKGGRLVILEQQKRAQRFYSDIPSGIKKSKKKKTKKKVDSYMYAGSKGGVKTTKKVEGEFVEMLGWKNQSPLFDGLGAMDWKWWMQGNAKPAFAAVASHKIDASNKKVTPLGRYLAPHFYWHGNLKKVYKSKIGYPVFAVKRDWGQLIICDLAIDEAIHYDPRAGKTLTNLLTKRIQ